MERTLIILKPDAVQRGLVGEIVTRFEKKGLQIVGMKMIRIPTDLAETHYELHRGKPFYAGLVKLMTSSPVIVLALAGKGAIDISRKMMGKTFGSQAEPGTIRGDFGVSNSFDPTDNIRGGVRYLRFLLDYYQGDYPKTIAAYNAGEAAVDKYNGVPPYAETRNYVVQVARNLKAARQTVPKTTPVALAQNEAPNPETTKPIQASTGSDGRVYYRTP